MFLLDPFQRGTRMRPACAADVTPWTRLLVLASDVNCGSLGRQAFYGV
jgi:hypothetical protein